ncbi:MAG: YchJ family metal-binding protein [Myxococcota bacterium]
MVHVAGRVTGDLEQESRAREEEGASCQGRRSSQNSTEEFAARFRSPDGSRGSLPERSEFVREGGEWFYVIGAPGPQVL